MSRTIQENKDKANDRTVKDKKTSYRLAASKVISCGVLIRIIIVGMDGLWSVSVIT